MPGLSLLGDHAAHSRYRGRVREAKVGKTGSATQIALAPQAGAGGDREGNGFSPLAACFPEVAGEEQSWAHLYGSAKALALIAAGGRARGSIVVITQDTLRANRLQEQLCFYHAGEQGLVIRAFPGWEVLPYDHFSPYHDIVSERLATLSTIPSMRRGVVVVSVQTVMQRLAPPSYIRSNSLLLEAGQAIDREAFRRELESSGYRCVPEVAEHGDFAARGSLLDVFPMGGEVPYRIDLLDDEIDSIRAFDPETQRSQEVVPQVRMLPAHEFPLTKEGIARFRAAWRVRFSGRPMDSPVYRDVSAALAPAGVESYLPLFFEQTATFFDYLSEDTVMVLDEGVEPAMERFWEEIQARYRSRCHDPERPLLEPHALFSSPDELLPRIVQHPVVRLSGVQENSAQRVFSTRLPPQIPVDARAQDPLAVLKRFLDTYAGRVLLVAETKGRRETLLELLSRHGLRPQPVSGWHEFLTQDPRLCVAVMPLDEGALVEQPTLAVITEAQLFGDRAAQRRRRRRGRDPEALLRDLTALHPGAPVVHEEHGVGRYGGLVSLETGGVLAEYLQLDYADGDKLYLPISSLHLLTRYSGVDPDHAPLHKLGSGQWQRAREKAAKRIRDVAAELLEIYSRRAARTGNSFLIDQDAYAGFVQGFPFEETPDQEAAIATVLQDMRAEPPMDRLVCGDAGFGKTEVALRATFVAINNGQQVAVLVPTTLLAQQHFQTFKDRFSDWPVRVERLSRFLNKSEQQPVIQGIRDGTVDIVIGTHKLLQQDIGFKRLGLVIIDEEHRFGVRQKERLKALRAQVDILTLTATPIPRSLNMALSGVRELSLIATPPARRLAVKTFVREWDDNLLREALWREVSRGGQVYFLHNEVKTIERIAKKVASLVPEATIRIAHGQMLERELERVMLDFYQGRFNVLVCTTIIESGIDVPSANTLVVNRADKFGLAQLYQLRGRVGRSHHRAYAYLLVPSIKGLAGDAKRRLEAIESMEELGIGFTIAAHDLEIRGAGEILGEEQSGHIQAIGFALYTELLERAVCALRSGQLPDLERPADRDAEVDLRLPALLPEDYLPDVHMRLTFYKRIGSVKDPQDLADLKEEVIDRFGILPPFTDNLFRITGLKLRAARLGIRRIEFGAQGGRVQFAHERNIDPSAVIELVQTKPQEYRLEGGEKLRVIKAMPDGDTRLRTLSDLLEILEAGLKQDYAGGTPPGGNTRETLREKS